MMGTATASTEFRPAAARTKEITVKAAIHAR